MDLSAAVSNTQGELIAQGLTLPLHLGSVPEFMRAVIAKFGGRCATATSTSPTTRMKAARTCLTCIYANRSSSTTQRLLLSSFASPITPTSAARRRAVTAVTRQNFIRKACASRCSTLRRGRGERTIFDFIARNVRIPRQVLGDLRAELACLHVGEQGVHALFEKYGGQRLEAYFVELLNYAERTARAEITALPDGVYAFTDYLDDDGVDPDPIPITVTVTVQGDGLTADFTGTSPQVKGGINCPLSFTQSATYACVRCLMGPDVPNNGGYFRRSPSLRQRGRLSIRCRRRRSQRGA